MDQQWPSLQASLRRLNDPRDRDAAWLLAKLLLALETIACLVIIAKVPYTEIDWKAYMQEVKGYQQGERDYLKLRGDTGPLVYPAGFVHLFSFLRAISGESISIAQMIFAGLYVANQGLVMTLYIRTMALPPWGLLLFCISRRLHSIFVLRLFNDCWAMFFAYAAMLVVQSRRYRSAIILFSLAVSVKMNVLLMAPGVVAVMIKEAQPEDVFRGVIAGILLQILLAAEFILQYPMSYLTRAFEFSRVFLYQWTVNWHFMPEEWFVSRPFAFSLLLLHLGVLFLFAKYRWFEEEQGIMPAVHNFLHRLSIPRQPSGSSTVAQKEQNDAAAKQHISDAPGQSSRSQPMPSVDIIQVVFTANFIGILFSRTLHYQFYSWYFHTLPFLLLRSRLFSKQVGALVVVILVSIEAIWNIYPPRAWTSIVLLIMHLLVLLASWNTSFRRQEEPKKKSE